MESINIERNDDIVTIEIQAEVPDNRKAQIYVSKNRVADALETLWNNIKTKSAKLQKISIDFIEQDWYDSDCDMYEVPSFTIGRGLRKAKDISSSTGTIPKEWSVVLTAKFKHGRTRKPFLQLVEGVTYLSMEKRKEFEIELSSVLRGSKKYGNVNFEQDED